MISLRDKPFFVLGDFNDNFLHVSSKVKQIILNAKLTQLIDKPTRVAPNSATLLDLMVTSKSETVMHSDVTPCHVGDLELITITIDLKKPKRQPVVKTFHQLKNYSPEKLCSLLQSESHSLNKIFTTDNVDTQIHIFNEHFIECLEAYAPIVTKEVKRPFASWITEDLKAMMQERDVVQQQLKRNGDSRYLQDKYKTLKKQVKKTLRDAKSQYNNRRLEENRGI